MIIKIEKTKHGINFNREDGVEFTTTQKELLGMADIERLPRKIKKKLIKEKTKSPTAKAGRFVSNQI